MEKRYGDAAFCISEAEKKVAVDKDKNTIGMWKNKVEMHLSKLDEDDPMREVTIPEVPDVEVPMPEKKKESATVSKPQEAGPASTTAPLAAAPTGVSTPANRIRHEWYQTPSQVVLTVYVKGVPKDKATVEITNDSVSVAFPLPTGSEWTFDVSPLFDQIDSAASSFSILSTKIEIKLVKANQGRKWGDLEGKEAAPSVEGGEAPTVAPSEAKEASPIYPTSSKKGPKDWDKLAEDLTAHEDDDPEGLEYESDLEGGDPVNHFFKKLYKDADEDTRRAMMKSYVESNGTALSTNWSEVGKGKVEVSPPGR
ncbi:SGS-domain-containing protein [Choiromyces venosus 120613-1]|uniref:SGS-domain-containing protein n=1 Tax=Choiromyces venosus 120613-1 TaxID=1336337 RepID=A0A3N4JYR9_9PEZI|nr:SGS-domain-containing protein [Choiromyces venosus 120613-1]